MTAPLESLTHNLVLIGGRGSGKSSVCRRILRREKRFVLLSTDDLVRYEAGALTIPAIVEQHGWQGFRALERDVVRKVAQFRAGALIDCGGGIVIDLDARGREVYSPEKVDALRAHGCVIYLRRDTNYLLERIAGDENRPNLSAMEGFAELMQRRDPLYQRAAHHVLEATALSKREIVARVLELYARFTLPG